MIDTTVEPKTPKWLKGVKPKVLMAAMKVASEKGSASVGRVGGWTIRIRAVKCGKQNCRKCPHKFYAYRQKRIDGKIKTKYLGVVRFS